MELSRVFVGLLAVFAVVLAVLSPSVRAQDMSPSPSPAPAAVSDGTSVDQGIAYLLMLMALLLTYLMHPLDSSSYKF